MATLARFQAFAQDAAGNVLASASVEVRREFDNAVVSLYSDRSGATPIGNPFNSDSEGYFAFHVAGGAYKITVTKDALTRVFRYVGIGTSSEVDAPAGGPVQPQGRLTLTSGVALTSSDVSGATTVYYTPIIGNLVPIYDGVTFHNTDIVSELSNITTNSSTGKAGPAAVANNSIYDLFIWDDAGTIRLTRGPAWSSDTTRGTGAGTSEIQQISGTWTNKQAITNGPAANRGTLVGSVRSNGSAQLEDSFARRWVSNIFNAAPRPMRVIEATDSWTYTTLTWRQARASAANQLDYLQSLAGNMVEAQVVATVSNTNTGTNGFVGIGLDSTTTLAPGCLVSFSTLNTANFGSALFCSYKTTSALGRHFLAWLEQSSAVGTATWYGDLGLAYVQSGIHGSVVN